MSLGLSFIPPVALIILFWMALAGMLGWAAYAEPWRFPFYLFLIPAFLVLLLLTTGNYPQRDLSYIYREPIYYSNNTIVERVLEGKGTLQKLPEDQFGDQIRRGRGNSLGLGRNLQFGIEQRGNRDRENSYKW